MPQTIFIDSKTMLISTANPIQEGDGRSLVEINAPEGTSIIEVMGVAEGWLRSFKGLTTEQRRTVAKIQFG